MLIAVNSRIIIEVENAEQAEEACALISSGLPSQMGNFPHGEVVDVDVSNYNQVSADEADFHGWNE